jgi:general secretion pathway protein A
VYRRHWSLTRLPFQKSQQVDWVFESQGFEEAKSRLSFLVDHQRRAGLVRGPAGTGKTLLFHLVANEARRAGQCVVQVDALGIDHHEFVIRLCEELRLALDPLATLVQCWSALRARLQSLERVGTPALILIDHLDQAEYGVSLAIQRLVNLMHETYAPVTIAFATRDSFTGAMAILLSEVTDLLIELAPWSSLETGQFVTQALQQSGSNQPVFTVDAIEEIQRLTRGIPAEVIRLADMAMIASLGAEADRVTAEIVAGAATELLPRSKLHFSSAEVAHLLR